MWVRLVSVQVSAEGQLEMRQSEMRTVINEYWVYKYKYIYTYIYTHIWGGLEDLHKLVQTHILV